MEIRECFHGSCLHQSDKQSQNQPAASDKRGMREVERERGEEGKARGREGAEKEREGEREREGTESVCACVRV